MRPRVPWSDPVRIAHLVLAAIFLIAATTARCAAETRLTVVGLPSGDFLNVRSAPGGRNPIVNRLAPGFTGIVATGRSRSLGGDKWIEISTGAIAGWVNARFVASSQTETPQATPQNIATDALPRIALVIGNSSYRFVPRLGNPERDARAVAAALRADGFDQVLTLENATGDEMRSAIAALRERAKGAGIVVLYFAGHGLEINGQNFIVPINAKIDNAQDVLVQALDLTSILEQLDELHATKIMMLDACRDNPFRDQIARSEATRSLPQGDKRNTVGIGFGSISAGRDTLVAYAAKHGSYALDGQGSNSPFAEAVVNNLKVEGVEVGLFFRRVRDAVLKSTEGKQEPFTYGSLGGDEIFLAPVSGGIVLNHDTRDRMKFKDDLKAQTDGILRALKLADFRGLADYVHPVSGLMFDGVVLRKSDLREPSYSLKTQTFQGFIVHEGYSDQRYRMSLRDYTTTQLYTRDFLLNGEVSLGERKVGGGADLDPAFQDRPGSIFVDYYVPNRKNDYDWQTLRLILERYNSRWFLTEITKKAWKP